MVIKCWYCCLDGECLELSTIHHPVWMMYIRFITPISIIQSISIIQLHPCIAQHMTRIEGGVSDMVNIYWVFDVQYPHWCPEISIIWGPSSMISILSEREREEYTHAQKTTHTTHDFKILYAIYSITLNILPKSIFALNITTKKSISLRNF